MPDRGDGVEVCAQMIIPRTRDELARWITAHGVLHLHLRWQGSHERGWVVVTNTVATKCGTSECLRVELR